MKIQSYWLDTYAKEDDKHHNLSSLPKKFDVIIIGAGYTGLNAALVVAKAGMKVLLLESKNIGYGASSRNAGMLLPGFKASMEELYRKYGATLSKELWTWSLDSIEYVKNLISSTEIKCDWHSCGSVELAHREKYRESF